MLKENEWCCWVLSQSEIAKSAERNNVELTDDDVDIIVEEFKDAISLAFEDWEDILDGIVDRVCCIECKKLNERSDS